MSFHDETSECNRGAFNRTDIDNIRSEVEKIVGARATNEVETQVSLVYILSLINNNLCELINEVRLLRRRRDEKDIC